MDEDLDAETATYSIAALGAINWGLQETADMNLVTEVLGSGNAGLAYIVIGIAGVVFLTERFHVTEFFDE